MSVVLVTWKTEVGGWIEPRRVHNHLGQQSNFISKQSKQISKNLQQISTSVICVFNLTALCFNVYKIPYFPYILSKLHRLYKNNITYI
jgi:hypothetical protein